MYDATVAQQVRGFIVENFLFGQDTGFKDNDSFLEGGIIDSTGVLQLIACLQETYGIVVEDEEVTPENMDTLNNVTAYVLRKLNTTEEASAHEIRAHAFGGEA